jgi:site-specific recombinase XerD
MSNPDLLGPWVRRFLLEYLVGERNFAENTRRSYRDALALLIPFIATATKTTVDRLRIEDLGAANVRQFLGHLEQVRACGVTTRNQRLAALHSLARFIGARSPEHLAWCSEICSIPFKKAPHEGVCYLEKHEMDALLDAPDTATRQGFRDHALLLFLYNSGARASEAVGVTVGDLDLPDGHQASVRLRGKGSKLRRCPLWASTAGALRVLIGDRSTTATVFLNRCGHPLTRYGVHDLVARYGRAVAVRWPGLAQKRVSPHTIRHTTATHLLRAGVDINTIRAWLGHVSVETTNIYAEIDLDTKAKALAKCAILPDAGGPPIWKDNRDLLVFLRSL